MRPKRQRAEARSGARGEALAAAFLEARGYRIVGRNLRTRHGEIDLLAQDGSTWAAVEVKARADHPAPEATVRPEQLQRIGKSLQSLAHKLRPRPRALRIDIVAIRWLDPNPEVRHFQGVRRWHIGPGSCGSASVPEQDLADTPSHGSSAASAFRLLRKLARHLVRSLIPSRARTRPSDGDPR